MPAGSADHPFDWPVGNTYISSGTLNAISERRFPRLFNCAMSHGIVYDIRSFSVHDGPGIRTTVFLKGCPLRCAWCHNPESLEFGLGSWICTRMTGQYATSHEEQLGQMMSPAEVAKKVIVDRPFFEESGGGVTISGGEPLSQADFCVHLLKFCRQDGIHTAIDTSGYGLPDDMEALMEHTDLFLYDLKIMDPQNHVRFTGVENGPILENFRRIYQAGKRAIVRIPLVQGITDTEGNIGDLIHFLDGYPGIDRIDLLPYHAIASHKYKKLGVDYPLEKWENYPTKKAGEIRKLFEKPGREVCIGG